MQHAGNRAQGAIVAGIVVTLGVVAPTGMALADEDPLVEVAPVQAAPSEVVPVTEVEPAPAAPACVEEPSTPQVATPTKTESAQPIAEPETLSANDAEEAVIAAEPAREDVVLPEDNQQLAAEVPAAEPTPVTPPTEAPTADEPAATTSVEAVIESIQELASTQIGDQPKRTVAATSQSLSDILLQATDIAAIGDVKYGSLKEAIEAAANGSTVKMMENCSQSDYVAIGAGRDITIDLNGKKIDYSGSSNVLFYVYGGRLTIDDSSESKSGEASAENATNSKNQGRPVWVANGGDFTLLAGKLSGKDYGIFANGGNVKVSGGEITGRTYGIAASNAAEIEVSGGKVHGNTGLVAQKGATATITGGTIKGDRTGVNLTDSDLSISGGTISGSDGYGVYCTSSGEDEHSVSISNHARIECLDGYGVSVFVGKYTIDMSGGSIRAKYYCITNNGNENNPPTTMSITGGTLTGTEGFGVYHPGRGSLTIGDKDTGDGPTIGGIVEIRAGELDFYGGTVKTKSDQEDYFVAPNDSGGTTHWAALAIAQHKTKFDITVNIYGGMFTGNRALSIANPQGNGADDGDINVSVKGGTFVSTDSTNNRAVERDYSGYAEERVDHFITGGIFSSPVPGMYCGEGYVPIALSDGTYSVTNKFVALPEGVDRTYNGAEQYAFDDADGLERGDAKTDAGSYTANVRPAEFFAWSGAKDTVNYTDIYGDVEKCRAAVEERPVSWSIAPKPILGDMVYAHDQTYDGLEKRPVVVTDGAALVEGKDYDVTYEGNTVAGRATYKVVGKGNYTGVLDAAFVIAPRDVEDPAVSFLAIEDQAYTGERIEPDVVVSFGGEKLVEGRDYTLTYFNNQEAGEATVTVSGRGNFAGTKVLSFWIAEPKAGSGEVVGTVVLDKDAPVEGARTTTDLVAAAELSDDELAVVESGENARVWLEVGAADIEDGVSAAVARRLEHELGSDYTVIFLDLSLYKQVGSGVVTGVHETSMPVEVTLDLPEELLPARDEERTYVVVRVHGGQVQALNADFDAGAGTLTFSTDRFSTYGVAYADKTAPEPAPEPTPTPVPAPDPRPEFEQEPEPESVPAPVPATPRHLASATVPTLAVPATGDAAPAVRPIALFGAALAVLGLRQRTRRDR